MAEEQLLFRVLLIGAGVGKSSILTRQTGDSFTTDFMSTIGVDFKVHRLMPNIYGRESIKLQIWDTAGQERFRALTKTYYRNSQGAIIVYDVTNRSSFLNVTYWLNSLREVSPHASVILVGNKMDDTAKRLRAVTTEEGEEFANANNLLFIETSAKSATNVNEMFDRLVTHMYKRKTASQTPPAVIKLLGQPKRNWKCCM